MRRFVLRFVTFATLFVLMLPAGSLAVAAGRGKPFVDGNGLFPICLPMVGKNITFLPPPMLTPTPTNTPTSSPSLTSTTAHTSAPTLAATPRKKYPDVHTIADFNGDSHAYTNVYSDTYAQWYWYPPARSRWAATRRTTAAVAGAILLSCRCTRCTSTRTPSTSTK
jgi:hypothetical protein